MRSSSLSYAFQSSARRLLCAGSLALAACGGGVNVPQDELRIEGELDRNGVTQTQSPAVEVAYASELSRGDWWPCDLRVTAQECVGDAHVNVYLTLPSVSEIADVGGAACVNGGEARGLYEWMAEQGGRGEYEIGQDLNAFVLVASDHDDTLGADFNNDTETKAVSRLVSGTLRVDRWADYNAIGFHLEGETSQSRRVTIDFLGPTYSGSVVPLSPPDTCLDTTDT